MSKMKITVKKYEAAPGAPFSDEEAPVVGAYFEGMEKRGMMVTPQAIVAEAAPADNILHKYFTWNDAEAASRCRLDEARRLAQSLIVIVRRDSADVPIRARHSVNVTGDGDDATYKRAYVSVIEVQRNEGMRHELLQIGLRELVSWREKYRNLGYDELNPVYAAIDSFLGNK